MFEINDYKFLNYNIKNKIDREEVGKKRFKKFKEKINEFETNNLDGVQNLSLKIKKGEDAVIYCNDLKKLKIFLDNITTKNQKYFLSKGYRKIRIFKPNNIANNQKKFFKELNINMLEWGLFPNEISKIKNYLSEFNFEDLKDGKNFKFLIYKSLISTLKNSLIFFLNLAPTEKIFEAQNFKDFQSENIILYLTTDINFKKKCNFSKKIEFDNIEDKKKNNEEDVDEEEDYIN